MDVPERQLTREGAPRGYIDSGPLRELWLHTGTACNLACPFCLEGSKPGDRRLQLLRFDDVRPYLDEAVELGVQQFSFTGGEPFLARDLPRILTYAAALRPCLVLTNATLPLLRRLHQIEALRHSPHPVSFRVSIDYPDRERHDAGRGRGSFEQALQGLKALHDRGFGVSIARQWSPGEETPAVEDACRRILRDLGLPESIPVIGFPDFHPPGSHIEDTEISEDCMTRHHSPESRAGFMCAFSRMLVKIEGRMRVYACTLVDDDPDYDLGATLQESLGQRILLSHHRCLSCFRHGASCSEMAARSRRPGGEDMPVPAASMT